MFTKQQAPPPLLPTWRYLQAIHRGAAGKQLGHTRPQTLCKTRLCNSPARLCFPAGAMKILYDLPIIWFLLGKYAVALSLTAVTDESIVAVAWDSAGVTTGPVTVPFVLAIGIGFSQAVNSGARCAELGPAR